MELMNAGIPVPKQRVVQDKAELPAVCAEFGFPLVLKIHSPDILHKTEAGGVRLHIGSLEEAEAAFDGILTSCRAYAPQARLEGVLVQQMAKPGLEIILGIKNDRQLGPMLLVGLGGVFVEMFRDTQLIPCPISETEALDALKSLRSYRLLTGYRGSKPCDIPALAKLMVRLSEYAVANKNTLKEMDINPVYVYEEGAGVCVIDALIVKEKE
jgi:acyl-CoA synthetase (NDP forming)